MELQRIMKNSTNFYIYFTLYEHLNIFFLLFFGKIVKKTLLYTVFEGASILLGLIEWEVWLVKIRHITKRTVHPQKHNFFISHSWDLLS